MSRSGDVLREARQACGLSQRELGLRCKVGPTLISAYENGRRTPSGDVLLRLLEACGAKPPRVAGPINDRQRQAAAELEQVAALAMALPRRARGELRFPSFRTFGTSNAQEMARPSRPVTTL